MENLKWNEERRGNKWAGLQKSWMEWKIKISQSKSTSSPVTRRIGMEFACHTRVERRVAASEMGTGHAWGIGQASRPAFPFFCLVAVQNAPFCSVLWKVSCILVGGERKKREDAAQWGVWGSGPNLAVGNEIWVGTTASCPQIIFFLFCIFVYKMGENCGQIL